LEIAKRRSIRAGEPAWRRLEQRLEQKRTAELISNLEDYDLSSLEDPLSGERSDKARRR